MNPLDPEPKDTIEDKKDVIADNRPFEAQIQDKDLATKKPPKRDLSNFLVWMAVFFSAVLLLWGYSGFLIDFTKEVTENKPFLHVTNRDLSVFLWQFPNLLRQNVKSKTDYLTGFELEGRVGIKPGYADQRAIVPPEVLFLYHTWDRLLKEEFIERSISRSEFFEFLTQNPEWLPERWKGAPDEYVTTISSLDIIPQQNLSALSKRALPDIVRMAFQGWKNFFSEGEFIDIYTITYGDLKKFLEKSPHYARNFWINIVKKDYPNYLETYTSGTFKEGDKVPSKEIPPFLKVAIFNMVQSEKNL